LKTFFDPVELGHAPQFFLMRGQVRPHYEVPARAIGLLAACKKMGLDIEVPPPVSRGELLRVHTGPYLDFLRDAPAAWAALPEAGPEILPNIHPAPEMLANGAPAVTHGPANVISAAGWYTADLACPITAETWPAAEAAAACALAAANEAASGRDAYALCRPPGHHAYAARAGGHCYLNNAALAAERLRLSGAARVAILDIDSHHGNGTQGIFWDRDDVLFVSVHGDPSGYYPWFVGYAAERGAGPGAGFNLNLPLARGASDQIWLAAVEAGCRAISDFRPDAIVVSLGFDASRDEPLGFLAVTPDGFARAGKLIGALGRPAVVVQEGGYAVSVLGELLERFLGGLAA
jgi:acetoin utilization deacetylase AcuC-like enzyme